MHPGPGPCPREMLVPGLHRVQSDFTLPLVRRRMTASRSLQWLCVAVQERLPRSRGTSRKLMIQRDFACPSTSGGDAPCKGWVRPCHDEPHNEPQESIQKPHALARTGSQP
jgi:hypothetical protein